MRGRKGDKGDACDDNERQNKTFQVNNTIKSVCGLELFMATAGYKSHSNDVKGRRNQRRGDWKDKGEREKS